MINRKLPITVDLYLVIIFLIVSFLLSSCGSEQLASKVMGDGGTVGQSNYVEGGIRWDSSRFPLTIRANVHDFPENSERYASLQNAVDTWNRAMGRDVFTLVTQDLAYLDFITTTRELMNDEVYTVSFPQSDQFIWDRSQLASAHVVFNSSTKIIVQSDIIFNKNQLFRDSALYQCRDCFDLESVALHELGHFLGLEHPPEGTDSVMKTSIAPNEMMRDLRSYDIESIDLLYPAQ